MKLDVTTFVLTLAKFICHKKVKKLRQELLKISSFSYLWDFFLARWPHFFGGELEKRFTESCFGFCGGPVFDDHQHENCVTLICTSPNSFVMPYWTNRYELEKNGRQVFPNNCFSFCMCQAGLLLLFTAAFSSFVRKLVSRSVVSSIVVATWWETSPQTIHEAIYVTIRILYVVSVIQIQVLFLFSFHFFLSRTKSIVSQIKAFLISFHHSAIIWKTKGQYVFVSTYCWIRSVKIKIRAQFLKPATWSIYQLLIILKYGHDSFNLFRKVARIEPLKKTFSTLVMTLTISLVCLLCYDNRDNFV